jgi:ferredoxin-type protein NapF
MNRREFIKSAVFFFAFVFSKGRFYTGKDKNAFIRPPGAVKEEDFWYKCIRCGKCFNVCPSRCLKPVSIGQGVTEWGTPYVLPREAGCIICLSCSQVCPSGAIQRIKQQQIKMGTSQINRGKCLVWTAQKDCLVCMEYCPVGAIFTDKLGRPIVDEKICVGCGLCEENCPVKGKSAIIVTTKGEKRYDLKKGRVEKVQKRRKSY